MHDYVEAQGLKWFLLNNSHDSMLWEAPSEEIKHLAEKSVEFMTPQLTTPRGESFSMKAEAQCGRNWAPMKKKKDGTIVNPEGLRVL
jgi:DNA polymerase I-like protein with 3'-5' exonuclease and polymerase domains